MYSIPYTVCFIISNAGFFVLHDIHAVLVVVDFSAIFCSVLVLWKRIECYLKKATTSKLSNVYPESERETIYERELNELIAYENIEFVQLSTVFLKKIKNIKNFSFSKCALLCICAGWETWTIFKGQRNFKLVTLGNWLKGTKWLSNKNFPTSQDFLFWPGNHNWKKVWLFENWIVCT